MPFAFEKLIVYQRAVDFADEVCALTESFARGYGFLNDQLNRAALSISANIAEGNGRLRYLTVSTSLALLGFDPRMRSAPRARRKAWAHQARAARGPQDAIGGNLANAGRVDQRTGQPPGSKSK